MQVEASPYHVPPRSDGRTQWNQASRSKYKFSQSAQLPQVFQAQQMPFDFKESAQNLRVYVTAAKCRHELCCAVENEAWVFNPSLTLNPADFSKRAMSVLDFLLLLLIAGVCGSLAQAIAGYSHGGCLVAIALGFIGALF